jgi:hypothetical protein
MASLEQVFSEIAAVTRRHRNQTVTSSIVEHNAILSQLKEEGSIKSDVSGGTEIQYPVALTENATIQNYAGWDTLNPGQSDSVRPARYGWAQKSIHVSASGSELRQNSGKEAMVRLVKMRQDIAEQTAANRMAIELYGDGSAYESINGLGNFLTADGTGTVGGIDSSTYTNWKSQFYEMTGTNAWSKSTIEGYMAVLYKKCVVGNDRPNLIMASHDVFTAIEEAIIDKSRYYNGGGGYMDSKKAHSNFDSIIFRSNVPVVYDSNTNFSETAELAYFINTKHMELKEHPQAKWEFEEPRKPVNADGVIIPSYWMGQFCCKQRRTSGRLLDAA